MRTRAAVGNRTNGTNGKNERPRAASAACVRSTAGKTRRATRARRFQGAFTLIELMAALAIAAVLIAAVLGALSATVRSATWMRRALREARLCAGIERLLREDLAGAVWIAQGDPPSFAGAQPLPSQETVPLAFYTSHSLAGANGSAGSGLVRVDYVLRPSDTVTDSFALFRRETPWWYGLPPATSHSREEPLADGLAQWQPRFFDGTQWQIDWQKDALPAMVGVDFSLARTGGPAGVVHAAEAALPAQGSLVPPEAPIPLQTTAAKPGAP